jgi:hypothetical protein
MADDHEDRLRQHEAMLEGLARIWDAQHAINQEQREINQRLTLAIERMDRAFTQQAEFNSDVRTTLARLETLLARMTQQSENGRDA